MKDICFSSLSQIEGFLLLNCKFSGSEMRPLFTLLVSWLLLYASDKIATLCTIALMTVLNLDFGR